MTFDVCEIIEKKKLVAYFQPVVSIAKKNICGLEGLIRGINTETGEIIPPLVLFDAAEEQGVQLELDRACREVVMQAYKAICMHKKTCFYFLILILLYWIKPSARITC